MGLLNLPLNEFIKYRLVSVRLENAINKACGNGEVPFETVEEYLEEGPSAFLKMLSIPDLGRKSARELDKLIIDTLKQKENQDLDPPGEKKDLQGHEVNVEKIINSIINILREEEFKILLARGLSNSTLENLRDKFGVTRERIRKLEKNAIKKIKKIFHEELNFFQEEIIQIIKGTDNQTSLKFLANSICCGTEDLKFILYVISKSREGFSAGFIIKGNYVHLPSEFGLERKWDEEIKGALYSSNWPIGISELVEKIPNVPKPYVNNCLKSKFKARIRDNTIKELPKIPLKNSVDTGQATATDETANSITETQQVTVLPVPLEFFVKKAKVCLKPKKIDNNEFEIKGKLTSFVNGNSFDFSREAVTITFGGFSETIPAGSFVAKDKSTKFRYRGPKKSSGISKMEIGDDGRFKIRGKRLNFSGADFNHPIVFSIEIGNNFGETSIQFDNKLKFKGKKDI